MNVEMQTIKLLGAAQLAVFAASMLSDRLLASAVGSGNTSTMLVNISKNLTRLRLSNLVSLLNSAAIILLGVLFYTLFHKEYGIIALIALGFFLAEAITLAASKTGAYALVSLSQKFVKAGAPENSNFQMLGDFLYYDVDRRGYDIHMLFFCLGGILWYYLLYASKIIPRALSIWGLAAVCLLTLPTIAMLYHRDLKQFFILGIFYAPFELVLGIWLLFKR